MAQGGIRKGFFFYFGLFVLLLIAIFLIILVVLLFNPGKTILWMQYFTGDGTHQITKTTDTETDIDFNNLTRIEIDCSMADVTIQRHENIKKIVFKLSIMQKVLQQAHKQEISLTV